MSTFFTAPLQPVEVLLLGIAIFAGGFGLLAGRGSWR